MQFSPGEVLKEIIKYREKNDEYLEHSRAFSRLRSVALSATIVVQLPKGWRPERLWLGRVAKGH